MKNALIHQAKAGDAKARTKLVLSCEGFVRIEARRWPGLDGDALRQAGRLGVVRAIEAFDTDRDNSFLAYAAYWIRYECGKEARSQLNHGRAANSTIVDRLFRSTEGGEDAQTIQDDHGVTWETAYGFVSLRYPVVALGAIADVADVRDCPERSAAQNETARRIRAVLARLPEMDRLIIQYRYLAIPSWTLRRVAKYLRITRQAAHQRERAALARLRVMLGKGGNA